MQLNAYSFATINREGSIWLPADGLRAWLLESALANREEPIAQAVLKMVADRIAEMERQSRGVPVNPGREP